MSEKEKNHKVGSVNQILLARGMTIDEIRIILHYPNLSDRDRAYFRILYECLYRPVEALSCQIENYNKQNGEVTTSFTKRKFNRHTQTSIVEPQKTMIVSSTTQALLKSVIGNRKKGPIFNVSKRQMQKIIDNVATKCGIQRVRHITATGIKYKLVTLMALREAGERHHDLSGGDPELSAKASQHSIKIKEKHYSRYGSDEIQESFRKHHPGHKGEV